MTPLVNFHNTAIIYSFYSKHTQSVLNTLVKRLLRKGDESGIMWVTRPTEQVTVATYGPLRKIPGHRRHTWGIRHLRSQ